MLRVNKFLFFFAALSLSSFLVSCDKDETVKDSFDTTGTFTIKDQMARPAINTVFLMSSQKDGFNSTIPTGMSAAYKAQFVNVLTGFCYVTNALGMNKDAFADLLVKDVLNAKMSGTTTFFDGTNILTGMPFLNGV